MQHILLSAILAFLITFFAIPVIIQIAKSKKLYDEPDERKVHKSVIPTLGGLGIFAGFIIAMLLCSPYPETAEQVGYSHVLKYFAVASIVIFFLGLKDDILVLSANKKFIGQLIAAGIIMKFGGIYLDNMHGFLGIYEIPRYASIFLTVFTIIVITNSFNLIDGVDGLAGSLGFLTTLVFGSYFLFAGELGYAVMAFSLSGAIIAFLIYNFAPAKIFMGDTGSLLIGLINSILVIKFINVAATKGAGFVCEGSPAIGLAVLMIPLFDTLRVFGMRILDRRSPFSADRIHVHHFLLDLGFSHKKITITCVLSTLLFIVTAFMMRHLNTNVSIFILMSMSFTFIGAIYYFRQKKKLPYREDAVEKQIRSSHKIFSFAQEPVEAD